MFCEKCGKYSGRYPLCKNCYYEDNEEDYYEEDDEDYEEYEECTCIACNEEKDDDGYLFCKSCYYEYKDKVLILEIRNCTDIKVLDKYYDGRYRCFDGHIVKSKSEKEIDNYLFKKNIRHIYEKPISISANEEDDIHPDFYLYDMDIYIEHLGKEGDQEYDERTQYKVNIYKEKKLTVIFTHETTDAKDMQSALDRKLQNYIKGKINFL